jgi:peptidase E
MKDASKDGADKKKIFIYGGDFNTDFIRYMAGLTGKKQPRICFLPTASGDAAGYITRWFESCQGLLLKPYVQRTFISTYNQQRSFEEVLLEMDGIVVGGGNTLNMMAIWKAHGIDIVLKKAWERGVVLGGGSAGALCWFEYGLSDSRPMEITRVDGLGFLQGSNCPHYHSEKDRRPIYLEKIRCADFKSGYACDDLVGIYFEDNEPRHVVSLDDESNAYYVWEEAGTVREEKLAKEILRP